MRLGKDFTFYIEYNNFVSLTCFVGDDGIKVPRYLDGG